MLAKQQPLMHIPCPRLISFLIPQVKRESIKRKLPLYLRV